MEPTATTSAYTAVFDRAVGARLEAAERFVLALPALFPRELVGCDLAFQARAAICAVVMRFGPALDAPARQRLDFWCARAGVRATALDRLPAAQRSVFEGNLARCELRRSQLAAADLPAATRAFFDEAGADVRRAVAQPARPTLAIDVGGPGWAGVRFDREARRLFVPGALAPPEGDEVALSLRFRGSDRPVALAARVVAPRAAQDSAGAAAGFELAVDAGEATVEALAAACAPASPRPPSEQRAHPRYAVKAPVVVAPRAEDAAGEGEGEGDGEGDAPGAAAESATELDLASDRVENLSQGGAFVRTDRPLAQGARVDLTMRLPFGGELVAPAVVVMANERGMGVRFELDEAGRARLAAALAHLSARPRRALVVEDDELVRRMLHDALRERGFEVLTATDGVSGLSILADELLALDLLVTDVRMPRMDGEAFVRTIRREGGESDLAIVVVTGALEPGLVTRLEREGADAVLDKALGADLIAQAADAVLERKRLARA